MSNLRLLVPLVLIACSGETKEGPSDETPSLVPYGPDNGWYHAPDASLVPEEPDGAGWARGELPPNLRFTDQFGDEVWLYQFYGQNIYIDMVAEWCGPCATYAPYLDEFYQEYGDEATVLTVMLMDTGYNDGDADAVSRWVEDHGTTNPVLWLDSEELARARDIGSFPSIDLLDPELRLAQTGINQMFDDVWIEQVVERMIFAIGGSLDEDHETCDNGYDDDLDLIADCMDPTCTADAACAASEWTGSLSPCTSSAYEETSVVDIWQVEVRGPVASIEVDTVAAGTVFDIVAKAKTADQSWEESRVVGDDEWDCTYEPENFSCPLGWLRPGTWEFMVQVGTGGDELDGDCVDLDLAEYRITALGDVSMELVQDDVVIGDL